MPCPFFMSLKGSDIRDIHRVLGLNIVTNPFMMYGSESCFTAIKGKGMENALFH